MQARLPADDAAGPAIASSHPAGQDMESARTLLLPDDSGAGRNAGIARRVHAGRSAAARVAPAAMIARPGPAPRAGG